MHKFIAQFLLVTIVCFALILTASIPVDAQQGKAKNAIIVVYASWSAVCRDIRPVAQEIATTYKFSYIEYDIDSPKVQERLRSLNKDVPSEIPYVIVVRNGKVVFSKAYPNSTPTLFKENMTDAIAKYI